MRDALLAGEQAHDLFAFLRQPIAKDPVTSTIYALLVEAAAGLMPGWARELHGIRQPPGFDPLVVRPATWTLLEALRLAVGRSPVVDQARRRAEATPL